jgi:hypothetical protein
MEPPLINDLESDLEAQRTELADQLRQLRGSMRFKTVTKDFAEGAGLKADALGVSIASVLMRHPVPLAIAGSVALLFLTRRYKPGRKSKQAPFAASLDLLDRRPVPHAFVSRIAGRVSETAGDVFGSWTAALATSIERFAVELTREAAQGVVRAGDAMIASGIERLAQSLSQTGKV